MNESAPLHVLVGVDGDRTTGAVLRHAGDLARRLGARLDVVHVIDIGDVAGVVPGGLGAMPVPMDTPEERAAVGGRHG